MGKNIDNGYVEGNTILDVKNLDRTNPWAHVSNAVKLLGIPKVGCCDSFVPKYTTMFKQPETGDTFTAGDIITMTPTGGNTATGLRYFKWVVMDESGNEAYGSLDLANPMVAVDIDVTGLALRDKWAITLSAEIEKDCDCSCKVSYCFELCCGEAMNAAGSGTVLNPWLLP